MSAREILAYAITHAGRTPEGKAIKGGPYWATVGGRTPDLRGAMRYPATARGLRGASREADLCHARVIRIVRKARLEVGAAKESAAFEAETWRDASAVEVLRELVAYDDGEIGSKPVGVIVDRARCVLAASGPDPMPVVRAAVAWAGDGTRVIQAREIDLAAAVDAYREAGGGK